MNIITKANLDTAQKLINKSVGRPYEVSVEDKRDTFPVEEYVFKFPILDIFYGSAIGEIICSPSIDKLTFKHADPSMIELAYFVASFCTRDNGQVIFCMDDLPYVDEPAMFTMTVNAELLASCPSEYKDRFLSHPNGYSMLASFCKDLCAVFGVKRHQRSLTKTSIAKDVSSVLHENI